MQAQESVLRIPALNEYLDIQGLPDLTSGAQKLLMGPDSPAIRDARVSSFQTISGTGAVHLGALFLARFHPKPPAVYLSNPTWTNHNQIFGSVGLSVVQYPYFHPKTKGLDFDGMIASLRAAPAGSVILLHPCAHNPTGVDPTQDQWKRIAAVVRERNHFPFFDCAYQGFASGDLVRDAWAIRYFVDQGFEMVIAQSFAKNFGLYGQRTGVFHFLAAPGPDARATAHHVATQLSILQRSEISNPPAYGAYIAGRILNDPQLFAMWEDDLRTMSGRIIDMRKGLRQRLEHKGTPGSWEHITNQIGMFSFTGLTEPQVKILREQYHIYMVSHSLIYTGVYANDYRPRMAGFPWPVSTHITWITLQMRWIRLFGRRREPDYLPISVPMPCSSNTTTPELKNQIPKYQPRTQPHSPPEHRLRRAPRLVGPLQLAVALADVGLRISRVAD